MRFFKPRRLCIAAILLAGMGVCWWVMYEPIPAIRFVEFQTEEEKIVAVLRLEIPSEITYRSDGHGPQPLVEWSVWDGSKWAVRTVWVMASGQGEMARGSFILGSTLPTGYKTASSPEFSTGSACGDLDRSPCGAISWWWSRECDSSSREVCASPRSCLRALAFAGG
jgi:hypothetical protein